MIKINYTDLPVIGDFRDISVIQPNNVLNIDSDVLIDYLKISAGVNLSYIPKEYIKQVEQSIKTEIDSTIRQYVYNTVMKSLQTHAKQINCSLECDKVGEYTFKEIAVDYSVKLAELKARLDIHIEEEEYEQCSILRDEIIEIEQKLNSK